LEDGLGKVAIVGAGAWGTALCHHLAVHGVRVSLWVRREEQAGVLARTRENRLLPGVLLPPTVEVTHRLEQALADSLTVVFATPCHGLREVAAEARPFISDDACLVSAAKGIENETLLLTTEIIADVVGAALGARTVVLSGPSFAREVAQGHPTNVVAAAIDERLAQDVQQIFSLGRLRVYTSGDPIGVQVAGALKNVIAIAVGASDGLGLGNNTRAALITRGVSEVARLAAAKGGQPLTVAGLAGLGDLILTCTGDLSRNRTVGFELGRGRALADVLASLGHVAEGVTTAKSAHDLAQRLGVELPICSQVYAVLYGDRTPESAVEELLSRPLKRE
jgi:glycerol-3-phosphate dehydrogenase (NAD(P)+)